MQSRFHDEAGLRHCEGRSPAAIQTAFQLVSAFRKTDSPHGLPRRATRAMTGRGGIACTRGGSVNRFSQGRARAQRAPGLITQIMNRFIGRTGGLGRSEIRVLCMMGAAPLDPPWSGGRLELTSGGCLSWPSHRPVFNTASQTGTSPARSAFLACPPSPFPAPPVCLLLYHTFNFHYQDYFQLSLF